MRPWKRNCVSHVSIVAIEDRKTRKCGIDGCEKVENRLLHKSVKSVESANSRGETSLTTSVKNIAQEALQVVIIRIHGNAGSHEDTIALCDTGSLQTWVDQELLEKLHLEEKSDNSGGWYSRQLTYWEQKSWSYTWVGR